jgi:hypothetical protein
VKDADLDRIGRASSAEQSAQGQSPDAEQLS